ncbi:MAG: SIR2 family protein [Mycobacterium leprae]
MPNYIPYFPPPLLEDLRRCLVVPFIGAGFSRNARTPPGISVPDFNTIGMELAAQIPGYTYNGNPVDATSEYEFVYGRAQLVQELNRLLLIGVAQPGLAHLAFARLPWRLVITTNFDYLLEEAWDRLNVINRPVMFADQLTIPTPDCGITLLKIHGDTNHPERMIVTEYDYDTFLDRYALIATYLAAQLITKTALFIGYSLDDYDFRQIWDTIDDRLGGMRRLAYTILVGASPEMISRFERRGVRVINLPGNPANYNQILADVFTQLQPFVPDCCCDFEMLDGEGETTSDRCC